MPDSDLRVHSVHTLPEILSQPAIWLRLRQLLLNDPAIAAAKTRIAAAQEYLFVGCGSSYYLAESAAAAWTLLTGKRTRTLPASEILLFPELSRLESDGVQAIVVSRSGRTSETVRAAEFLSRHGRIPTFGVTCAAGSELTKACDFSFALAAADERSMVMTRSFTSLFLMFLEIATGQNGETKTGAALAGIASAMERKIQALSDQAASFTATHNFDDYIVLAQGPFFSVGREAALKMTEMSRSYSQIYHTLEFRHGPKTMVSNRTCLLFLLSETGMEEESEVLVEMKDLGGTIVAICNRASERVRRASDFLFELEADVPEFVLPAPFLVLPQLLGYHTGIAKGLNPDEPTHLNRVVILD